MKTKLFYWGGLLCLIFTVGCSGNKPTRYEAATADSVAVATNSESSDPGKPKLVKTADMRFKVKDVQQTGEAISALTTSLNGMVMHHALATTIERSTDVPSSSDSVMRFSSYNTNADMTVRLPSDKMEEFMNRIGHMAVFVNTRNMDIQDKTLDFLSSQLKVSGRNEIIAQQKKGLVKIKDIGDVLALKDDQVDKQIDNRRIEDAVKYSTIGLNFYQSNTVAKELIVNDDPSNYTLPFFRRLGNAFVSGWLIFAETLIALANIWVFILIAIGGLFAYRHYTKKPAAHIE
jgi:hypothetical protein